MNQRHRQTVALGALFQCLLTISMVARRGHADPALVQTCLSGLLRPYQDDLEALYGGRFALRPGLESLAEQLTQPRDVELTRYAVTLLHLEKRLSRQPTRLAALARGLAHAQRQAEYFDSLNVRPIIQHLASLYSEQISPLRPRVLVQGTRPFLEDPHNAELIRALLLAAIRAVSLWREAGGRRWQLLLRRHKLLACARGLAES